MTTALHRHITQSALPKNVVVPPHLYTDPIPDREYSSGSNSDPEAQIAGRVIHWIEKWQKSAIERAQDDPRKC